MGQNERLEQWICEAAVRYAGRKCPGSSKPYILHRLDIMNILRYMNADTELMGEAVHYDRNLYDMQDFGDTQAMDPVRKRIFLANMLAELRHINVELQKQGEVFWTRSGFEKAVLSKIYSDGQDHITELQNDSDTQRAYWEAVGLYKDIFVEFQKSHPLPGSYREYLLQISAHGEIYRMDRVSPRWYRIPPEQLCEEEYSRISRAVCERTEESWCSPLRDRISKDLWARDFMLLSEREHYDELQIRNAELALHGETWGETCRAVSGLEQYEYLIALDKENTERLLVELRLQYGLEADTESLLTKVLGDIKPSVILMELCQQYDVDYRFYSF